MSRGQQVLARLVLAEVNAGRLMIRRDRFVRDGIAVRPVLAFERAGAPAKSTAAADIRRSASESELGYPQFAELPESRLMPSNEVANTRAGMAEQRHSPAELMPPRREAAQTIEWQKSRAAAIGRSDPEGSLRLRHGEAAVIGYRRPRGGHGA